MSEEDRRKSDIARVRKETLEEKKKKLEKLRETKLVKVAEVEAKKTDLMNESKTTTTGVSTTTQKHDQADNIDEVVKSLLGDSADGVGGLTEEEIADRQKREKAAKMAALSSQHNVVNINIPSHKAETYEMGTQTIRTEIVQQQQQQPLNSFRKGVSLNDGGVIHEVGLKREETGSLQKEISQANNDSAPVKPFSIPELTEEEKSRALKSKEFLSFFAKSSRVIERVLVLNEKGFGNYDFTTDYTADESKEMGADKTVKEVCVFYDESLCKNRAVTDISWSPKHPELVVVAYSDRLSGTTDEGQEGMVIIWNIMTPSSPEMVFYCQSSVLRAFISQFNANLVIGSTYSGQIVVWDKSKLEGERKLTTPTSRTPLNPNGHTMPIFSMEIVGTDNANSLISVSTDGKLRSWNLQSLSDPLEPYVDLANYFGEENKIRENLATSCMAFIDGDVSNCIVGCEDSNCYLISRTATVATKYVTKKYGGVEGHEGPITSVSCHPVVASGSDLSGLFLTSSMDWTIRLWDRKREDPIRVMDDSNDYVFDVKWSPSNPSVFASVDGTGQLSIWDLCRDIDLPIGKILVCKDHALNRVQWSKDGKKIAVGSSHGYCHLFDAKKEVFSAKGETREFIELIADLQTKADEMKVAKGLAK